MMLECLRRRLLKISFYFEEAFKAGYADVAQLVERHFCKVRVVGSSPSVGSRFAPLGNQLILDLELSKRVKAGYQ